MKQRFPYLSTAARLLLGLIFFVFGLNGFLGFLPMPPLEGAAAQFMGGLAASGYFFPLLKITEIVVGVALLANRFVPLALVVLAPITVNIIGFHGAMDPGELALPLVIGVAQVVLFAHHRMAYRGLLVARPGAAPAPTVAGEQRSHAV